MVHLLVQLEGLEITVFQTHLKVGGIPKKH